MSVVIDIFVWLLIESVMAFVFYSTGCLILKIFTLGRFKIEFKDFSSFKASKSNKLSLIYLLGLSFYISLIVLMLYLNN